MDAKNQTLNSHQSPVKLKPTEEQLNKKFDELYNQSSLKKQKLQRLKEQREREILEKQLKQCTFRPKVNPDPGFHGSKPSSFIKREQDWLSRKQKRIQELTKQSSTKDIQGCSFRPVISAKSISILDNPNKFTPNEKKSTQQKLKKPKNSYRQIYKKKQSEKNDCGIMLTTQKRMEKLMTQKRMQMKQISQEDSNENYKKSGVSLKTEEQETFNSISSMQLKTQNKAETKEEKSRIMILEDEFQNDHQEEAFQTNLSGNQEFTEQKTIEDYSEEQKSINQSPQSEKNADESSEDECI